VADDGRALNIGQDLGFARRDVLDPVGVARRVGIGGGHGGGAARPDDHQAAEILGAGVPNEQENEKNPGRDGE
jgi:hypothetical protein